MALRCVVVTPERTQLDREAEYISLPMFDGELGVMNGRAPMIGRLGYGTMKLQTAAGPERYYIDGGFAHVEGDVVNVLTGKAIPVDLLDSEEARNALQEALELPASSPEESQIKATAVMKARGQVRASR
ncbi:ATP synthase F1 subunit epsilon [Rubripirellula sp.]|jgi:F-type H+-transporting ATPase subunit epsilon|nr:ATP synthase F1 subunit epsilon [Rubripirellula sp.]MDA8697905.1 ATP synthase F1 subunit epsilon [Rhodopirellula sp.]MDA9776897.1 ATP synthase F1 subunit epsilon [Rubripirellula sp.]MDA9840365.1 ATP synthase F1 subunit epsilon [Rubripirellula sp.]